MEKSLLYFKLCCRHDFQMYVVCGRPIRAMGKFCRPQEFTVHMLRFISLKKRGRLVCSAEG